MWVSSSIISPISGANFCTSNSAAAGDFPSLKHLSGQRSLIFVVVEHDLTADNCVGKALRAFDDARSAARKITGPFLGTQFNPLGIKQHQVAIHPHRDASL